MPEPFSFGEIHLDVNPHEKSETSVSLVERPFHIAVLGDFSGRRSRSVMETGRELAAKRPIVIDRDNFDDVVERLAVELDLPVAGRIRFRELEDFHPDRLYSELEMFRKLREASEELEVSIPQPAAPVPPPAPREPDLNLDGLLEAAVEATGAEGTPPKGGPRDELRKWVEERVAPHLEPRADPRKQEWEALIGKTVAAQMRALLHFRDFQDLEAAWRSLFFLVRRLETGPMLKIHLLDISAPELAADLAEVEDLRETGLHRLLAGVATDVPWGVVACLCSFGPGSDSLRTLARLSTITGSLGTPLLAAADPRLAGCKSLAQTPDPDDWDRESPAEWREFRKLAVARGVGLALPRFLLRLPYGADTDPCEEIEFEEMGDAPEHERYLWGNPAVACVFLLAEAFLAGGWGFQPGERSQIDGLPLHIYRQDGESVAQPCAETLLTERAAERLLDAGLMPLVSYRDSDRVRLLRFQSVADPPSPLSAWWS